MEPLPEHIRKGVSAFTHGLRNAAQRFSFEIEIAELKQRRNVRTKVEQNA